MAVVQVVRMAVVLDGRMSAVGAVDMIVILVNVVIRQGFHSSK